MPATTLESEAAKRSLTEHSTKVDSAKNDGFSWHAWHLHHFLQRSRNAFAFIGCQSDRWDDDDESHQFIYNLSCFDEDHVALLVVWIWIG